MPHSLRPVTPAPTPSTPRTAFAWAERTALFGEVPPSDALPPLTRRVSPLWSTVRCGYGQPKLEAATVDAWKNARAIATKELLHHTLFHALRQVHSPNPDIHALRSLFDTAWDYEMGIMTSLGRRNLAGGSTKFPLLGVPLDPNYFVGKQFELREKEAKGPRTTARMRTRTYDATHVTSKSHGPKRRSKGKDKGKSTSSGKRKRTSSTSEMDVDGASQVVSESDSDTDSTASSNSMTETNTAKHSRSRWQGNSQGASQLARLRRHRTYTQPKRQLTMRMHEESSSSDDNDDTNSDGVNGDDDDDDYDSGASTGHSISPKRKGTQHRKRTRYASGSRRT